MNTVLDRVMLLWCWCEVDVLLLWCCCDVGVLLLWCWCDVVVVLLCCCDVGVMLLCCCCDVGVLLLWCWCDVVVLLVYCCCDVGVLLLWCCCDVGVLLLCCWCAVAVMLVCCKCKVTARWGEQKVCLNDITWYLDAHWLIKICRPLCRMFFLVLGKSSLYLLYFNECWTYQLKLYSLLTANRLYIRFVYEFVNAVKCGYIISYQLRLTVPILCIFLTIWRHWQLGGYIYHPISNSVKVCQYSLYLSQDECISVQNCLSITNKLSEAALYKCLSKGLYRIYQYRNHVSICIPKQQQPKEIYVQKPVKV